ncbi:transposase family protein [Microbispora sp. GKU 823]|uniref:transposase family protein n=1 Tax=Microbispora sp. GKU 823 TaxID=1652100 RepID=UPI0009CAF941|nr:hypothetical protein B1L11_09830 [Microbispora sp. GKU 823]
MEAACPDCGIRSRRRHSHHERRLSDAAVGGRELLIHLRVNRFSCPNATCPRAMFAEQPGSDGAIRPPQHPSGHGVAGDCAGAGRSRRIPAHPAPGHLSEPDGRRSRSAEAGPRRPGDGPATEPRPQHRARLRCGRPPAGPCGTPPTSNPASNTLTAIGPRLAALRGHVRQFAETMMNRRGRDLRSRSRSGFRVRERWPE